MEASAYKEYIFGMLFLKYASDQFEAEQQQVVADQRSRGRSQAEAEQRAESPSFYKTFYVPQRARWDQIRDHLHKSVGSGLNKALEELEHSNRSLDGVLQHIDFNRKIGQSSMSDKKLRELIMHFNKVPLRQQDFEFPDLLGAAYEYLIRDFADSAGKKGGEFYTPRDVVHHTPTYVSNGVPFLTVENLTRGPGISLTPCRHVSAQAHSEYRKRIEPLAGDVLVSKDGTLGIARIVPKGFPTASVFVSVAVLRPRMSVLRGDFLRLFFDTDEFKRQLRTLSAGSGLQHIHLEHFRQFLIPALDITEQKIVASAIARFDKCLVAERSVLEKLKLERRGLVADLLTGRVRVPSEVAS
jgi:hypothetical protein